jgi:hypothetical protein
MLSDESLVSDNGDFGRLRLVEVRETRLELRVVMMPRVGALSSSLVVRLLGLSSSS